MNREAKDILWAIVAAFIVTLYRILWAATR